MGTMAIAVFREAPATPRLLAAFPADFASVATPHGHKGNLLLRFVERFVAAV